MFKRKQDPYRDGFFWQGDLPLTALSCTHFVRVVPSLQTSRYITDSDYRESIINDSINTSESVSQMLFGLPIEKASGSTALLWAELLKPPPTHQIIVGYVVKTGKLERRILDINVSLSSAQNIKTDKDLSLVFGRYFVQTLQSATDRWALFRSGKNTEWYLNCLLAKYKSIRGVLQ